MKTKTNLFMNSITFSTEHNFNLFKSTLISIVQFFYNVTSYTDAEGIVLDTLIKLQKYNKKMNRQASSDEQIRETLKYTTQAYFWKGVQRGEYIYIKPEIINGLTLKGRFEKVVTICNPTFTNDEGTEVSLIENSVNELTNGDSINLYDFDVYFTWKFLEKHYKSDDIYTIHREKKIVTLKNGKEKDIYTEIIEKSKKGSQAKEIDTKLRKTIYDLMFQGYSSLEISEKLGINFSRISKLVLEITTILKANKDLLF